MLFFYDYKKHWVATILHNTLGSILATQWFREGLGYLVEVAFCSFFFFVIFPIFREGNKF